MFSAAGIKKLESTLYVYMWSIFIFAVKGGTTWGMYDYGLVPPIREASPVGNSGNYVRIFN